MTWIKICGTTSLADAELSIAAGANALGFIFAPSSRRVAAEAAAAIVAALPSHIEKIGVVVNQPPSDLAELAERVGLTGVQLHGDEAPVKLSAYRKALGSRKIIKTLQARELVGDEGAKMLNAYLEVLDQVDAVLVDSGAAGSRGGTGIPFDWNAALPLVSRIKEVAPVIIAGGLTPGNVADAIRLFVPWGVDVVSGVEREAGKKDADKLRAFVGAARSAAAPGSAQPGGDAMTEGNKLTSAVARHK